MGEIDGKTDYKISLGEATTTDLVFADNVLNFEKTLEGFLNALDTLSTKCEPLELNIAWIKANIHKFVAVLKEIIDTLSPVSV